MAFIDDQLAIKKLLLAQVQAAITTVLTDGQSYSLDSGQTRQSVTRSTLGELRGMENDLMNFIMQFDSSSAVRVVPGF